MAVTQETSVETAIARAAWEDALDPSLRDAARKYLRSLLAYPRAFNSHEDEVIRAALQKRVAQFPYLARTIPSQSDSAGNKTTDWGFWIPVGAILFFACLFLLRFEGPVVAFAILLIGVVTSVVLYLRKSAQTLAVQEERENQREPLLDALLPQALEQVATKQNERAYVDAVLDLLPSETDGYLSDELRIEQMSSLAALIASSRQIESVREQLLAVLKAGSTEILQEEIARLKQRREQISDEQARNTLTQSIALCEERIERNKSLVAIIQRLDAERELVYQTFGATRSMLATLRLSPATALDESGASQTVAIAETIARQTRSVEAAVQELGIRNAG